MDDAFRDQGKPVKVGSTQHFTPTHDAKGLAVDGFMRMQMENQIMTDRTFHRLFGTIVAGGIVTAIVSAVVYFAGLPIFTEETSAWFLFWGILAAGLAAFAITVRTIWNSTQ
jgi:hypothetical protein